MKTRSILVSTLLTVVLCSLCNSLTRSTSAWAEDSSPPDLSKEYFNTYLVNCKPPGCTPMTFEEFVKLRNNTSGSLSGCELAEKEFDEAQKPFGGDSGLLEVAMRCLKCKGSSLPAYCRDSEDRKEYTRRSRSSSYLASGGMNQGYDKTSKALEKKILACPNVAEKNADKIKEKIDKYEDQVKTLKEEIETAQEDILEQQTNIKEAESKYKDDDVPRIDKEKEESKTAFEEKYEKIAAEINEQHQKLSETLDKLISGMQELEYQKNNSIMAVQRECRNEARTRTLSEMQERRNKLNQNRLSVNSQSKLFSLPAASKTIPENAAKYYNDCLNYNKDRFESINADYIRRRNDINNAIGKTRQAQAQLSAEIGGPKMSEKYKAELQNIFDTHRKALEKAYNEYVKAVEVAGQKLAQLNKKLQEKQTELQAKEDTLANEIRVASLIDKSLANNPAGEDSGIDFIKSFTAYSAAADSLYYACKCEERETTTASASASCTRAKNAVCATKTSAALTTQYDGAGALSLTCSTASGVIERTTSRGSSQ